MLPIRVWSRTSSLGVQAPVGYTSPRVVYDRAQKISLSESACLILSEGYSHDICLTYLLTHNYILSAMSDNIPESAKPSNNDATPATNTQEEPGESFQLLLIWVLNVYFHCLCHSRCPFCRHNCKARTDLQIQQENETLCW